MTSASSWRPTILAALASYIDAGSIVAGAAGLAVWAQEFGLSTSTIGLIAAFSSNAISAGVGALVGGWLADRVGRTRVYRWDLLLFAFGISWIVFATQPWMLILGYVLTGLAVGADVPASWTLVVETAPPGQKGRRSGATQLLWGLGPLVVLTLALALSGLGVLGIRIVFAHLLVVALVLWLLRRRMHESPEWEISTATSRVTLAGTRQLLAPGYIVPVLLLMGMYGIWNLKAGTAGFFTPYLLRTVGAQSQAQSLLLQLGGFTVAVLVTVFVFMRLVDRARHWVLFAVGAGLQIAGMLALALFPLTTQVAIVYLALSATGGALGAQAFFVLWSAESFPTTLRATAMGLMFAIVRVALGIWSLFVPAITVAGFETLAWLLTGFLVVSSGCGLVFARHRRRASETVDLPRANGIAVRAT